MGKRIWVSLFLLAAGCTHRAPVAQAPAYPAIHAYVDLQPGWRLRAIVPLTKSGRHDSVLANNTPEQVDGNTITLHAKADFLGYETQYYSVRKHGDGVRIRFAAAQTNQGGVISVKNQPSLLLFDVPSNARHVRLVFLQRVSSADHNMAVLAAAKPDTLNALTAAVLKRPEACITRDRQYCAWIPEGIAVRPERPVGRLDEPDWKPVD